MPESSRSSGAVRLVARVNCRAGLRSILAVGVLLGLTAGVGLACIAGARRTATVFERHLVASHGSQVEIDPGTPTPAVDEAVHALPGVREASYWTIIHAFLLDADGGIDERYVGPLAFTSDGRFLEMDRVVVARGRRLDPGREDEVMLNEPFADILGVDVGDRVPIGLFPTDPDGVPSADRPVRRADAVVVGIMALDADVAAEAFDRIPRMFVSPAFAPPVGAEPSEYYGFAWYGLRLDAGDSGVDATVQAWRQTVDEHNTGEPESSENWLAYVHLTSDVNRKADRAVRPLVIALAGFGLLLFASATVLGAQSMSRAVRQGWDDVRIAQILGLRPREAASAGMAVPVATLVLALAMATITALVASSVFPVGPYAVLEPSPGIDADPAVVLLGLLALAIVLLVVAALACRREAAAGVTGRDDPVRRPSKLAAEAARVGAPPAIVAALRLTAEPGHGRTFVPTRSVVVSTIVTVAVATSALVFGANLRALADQPARFGWKADALLVLDGGYGQVAPDDVAEWAASRSDVEGWRVVGGDLTTIDGVETPGVVYGPGDGRGVDMVPVLVSGRAPAAGEVVLGAATLAAAGAQVGDRLMVGSGEVRREVAVVGTAIFPVLGPALASRTGLDRGAWLSPDDADLFATLTSYGPPFNFVELALAPQADLTALGQAADGPPFVESGSMSDSDVFAVVEPAEVSSAAAAARVQVLLVVSLATLAALSMFFTLLAVVRRRSGELDVYRTLGFTPRQLRSTILGQGLAFGICGLLIGVPVGVAIGRELWRRFADQLGVVPEPLVPWSATLALIVAVLLASLLGAAWPAFVTRRRPGNRRRDARE